MSGVIGNFWTLASPLTLLTPLRIEATYQFFLKDFEDPLLNALIAQYLSIVSLKQSRVVEISKLRISLDSPAIGEPA